MAGLELAGRFYRQVVGPLLGGRPHAAALLGDGSEVLGYDDAVSTDHDFGPRVQVFLPAAGGVDGVTGLLRGLPERFDGFPVAVADGQCPDAPPRHRVLVTTAAAYFTDRLGVDPAEGMGLADWLLTPTQILAGLTGGVVLHDPDRALALRRAALRWYPDDLWRTVLAAGWLRIGQEESFVGRAGGRGDDLGSRLVAARLVRDLVRLAFLIERRWAPYGKWLGRACADLTLAAELTPWLRTALAAEDWREREAALCAAGSVLGAATNALGLCPPVDPAPRRFHDRDILVVGAERFTVALTGAVTDPEVLDLLARLGRRGRTAIGRLPGAVDQAVDCTDVLSDLRRWRAAAGVLGLGPDPGPPPR
mgnify:CR=1 FL=1